MSDPKVIKEKANSLLTFLACRYIDKYSNEAKDDILYFVKESKTCKDDKEEK